MWNRRRTWLVLAALLCVALAAYFEPTYCVRGWLWRETFYQGRPTSFWRVRCDEWLERFDSPANAARWKPPNIAVPFLDDDDFVGAGDALGIRARPQTFWTRLLDRFRSDEDRLDEDWPPRILFGFPGSEPVLEELVREPRYEAIAGRALKYAKVYRKMGHTE